MQPQLDKIILAGFEAGVEVLNPYNNWEIEISDTRHDSLTLSIRGPEGHFLFFSTMFRIFDTILGNNYWWKAEPRSINTIEIVIEKENVWKRPMFSDTYEQIFKEKIREVLEKDATTT